jgi:tetratricopeptide (TPR) repeat protein
MFSSRLRLMALTIVCLAASPTLAQARASADLPAAISLFEQQQYDKAKSELGALVAADPKNATAMLYLGRIALIARSSGEAIGWLERAAAVDGKSSPIHYWLGVAYGQHTSRASKLRQAMTAKRIKSEFETAVRLDPANVNARMGLVQFYVIAPGILGGDADKAQQQVNEIARLSPYRGHLATAYIAERRERYADAEREYLAAQALQPDSLEAAYQLAYMYHRTKQYDKAFAMLDRFLAKYPKDPSLHYAYGRTAALSGTNLDRGEQALRYYLEQPEGEGRAPYPSAFVRLGMIQERRGNKDLAREEYKHALQLDPDQPEAKDGLKRVK